jgi:WhiB family redox-sensing transcriptional regulator
VFTREWHHRAVCRTAEPEIFFPFDSDEAGERKAKRVCQACPVRQICLDEAIDNNIHEGIWGGLNPQERRNLKRRIQKAAIAHPPAVTGEKDCVDCGETLPASRFSPAKQNRDGLSSFCKPCLAERTRKRRANQAVA